MAVQKKRRISRRYKRKWELLVSVGKDSLKAGLVNYSLRGIGFVVEGHPEFKTGAPVHFSIKALNLDGEGKIAWCERLDDQIRGGIERKSISGSLRHYQFADVLIDLQRSEKSGMLIVNSGPAIKKIFVKNGDIIFASSNREEDSLTEILLRGGKITDDQFYQISDIRKRGARDLGAVLVERRILRPEDLIWAVRRQAEEIILSLFHWEDGEFIFTEGPHFSTGIVTLNLGAANLVYRGIKMIKKTSFLENVMPAMNSVLSYSTDPMDVFHDVEFDKADKDILILVNGKRTLKEIVSLSPADGFQTMKTLYALLCMRILKPEEEGLIEERIDENILEEPDPGADADFIEKVNVLYSRLDSSDYYSILGIEKRSNLDAIKREYHRAVKEFHPDRHVQLSSETLRIRLNAIFSRITSAYKVLSDPRQRLEYDRTLTPGLERTRAAEPRLRPTDRVEMARSKFQQGCEAFRRGEFTDAKELIGQAIYLDNSIPSYHYRLGLVFMKEKNFQQAGKALNEALRLAPHNADYLAELGHIYVGLGFKLRAQSTFEKALADDPSNRRAAEGLRELRD